MPRIPRDYFLSDFLHVMVQGDEKKYIFSKNIQKEKFIKFMYYSARCYNVKIVAYCIMGNHAHILVYSKDVNQVSQMLHRCNTIYAIYFNKNRKRVGHVFRDRFRSENIYDKQYLINCIKYIHRNPVKAGMCMNCEEYVYSSFVDFLNHKKDYLLNSHYFTEEDMEEIIASGEVEEDFLKSPEDYENFEKVKKEVKKTTDLTCLTEQQLLELFYQIKKRCHVTDISILEFLKLTKSRFRAIKNRVQTENSEKGYYKRNL